MRIRLHWPETVCIIAVAVLLLATALGRQTVIDAEVEGVGLRSNQSYPIVFGGNAHDQPETVAVGLPLEEIGGEPVLRFTFFSPRGETADAPARGFAVSMKWADVQKHSGFRPAMTFRVTKTDAEEPPASFNKLQELLNQGLVDVALTMTQQFKEQLGPMAY